MKMNRRSFFRFIGRASGTAAAVVVGGAAVLPKVTGAVELKRADGTVITLVQHAGKLYDTSGHGQSLRPLLVKRLEYDGPAWYSANALL